MFIEGRTFSMSETAIQQIEYFDDCQGIDSFTVQWNATKKVPHGFSHGIPPYSVESEPM